MESLILQFSLKYLEGIKFQYVDVDFIVAELKKGSTAISQKWHKDHISHLRPLSALKIEGRKAIFIKSFL